VLTVTSTKKAPAATFAVSFLLLHCLVIELSPATEDTRHADKKHPQTSLSPSPSSFPASPLSSVSALPPSPAPPLSLVSSQPVTHDRKLRKLRKHRKLRKLCRSVRSRIDKIEAILDEV
jgi:hypothetical protein